MQNKSGVASSQSSLKSQQAKNLLDHKTGLSSSSLPGTMAGLLFSDFPQNDLSRQALLPYLSPSDLALAAATSRFFAAASEDCWFSLVKDRFSAAPVRKVKKDKGRLETYKEMYDRLQGWDWDIRREMKKTAPQRGNQEEIFLWERNRIRLFAAIVANGYDKFDLYYPSFRPQNMNTEIPPEEHIIKSGVKDLRERENRFAHIAAQHGQAEFLRKILAWGGRANAAGAGTVMHYSMPELSASFNGGPTYSNPYTKPIPSAKLEEGAGDTALILAAKHGHVNCLRVLLENPDLDNSANIDYLSKEISGRTALHAAAQSGHVECVRYLLAQGARTNIEDSLNGKKPLEVAEDPDCRDLIQAAMLERGERLLSCAIL